MRRAIEKIEELQRLVGDRNTLEAICETLEGQEVNTIDELADALEEEIILQKEA